jgi:hypothetical protein
MRFVRSSLIAMAGLLMSVVVMPAPTFAASSPVIESLAAAHVVQDDATLQAQIDPEGLETTYQLWIEDPCPAPMECIRVARLADGSIPAGTASESLSVDLASSSQHLNIEPNTRYEYWVIAKSSAGTVESRQSFTTPPAGTAPVIDSVSVSHLTPTDATLEAQIETGGLSTTYDFQLWSSPCSHHGSGCELIMTIPLPSGQLLGSFVAQSVSLDLNSVGVTLQGGEYGYSVTAANADGSTSGRWQTFEAPAGVIDPPSPVASPQAGGGQPAAPGGGDQATGSGTTSPTALAAASPTGGSAKTGAPKPMAERKHKSERKHHRTRAARYRALAKQHKR